MLQRSAKERVRVIAISPAKPTTDNYLINVAVVDRYPGASDVIIIPMTYGVVNAVTPLNTSIMRPVGAVRVTYEGGGEDKLKFATNEQGISAIEKETRGAAILEESPFADSNPTRRYVGEDIVLAEWTPAIIIEEGIVNKKLPPEVTFNIFEDLRTKQVEWWKSQGKILPVGGRPFNRNEYESYLRDEEGRVIEAIPKGIANIAKHFGIRPIDLWMNPMVINGILVPSAKKSYTAVHKVYSDGPPFLVKALMDAKRTNIGVVDIPSRRWKLIDPKFVYWGDPAEADAIESRYGVTTLAEAVENTSVQYAPSGTLIVNLTARFPKECVEIQRYANSRKSLTRISEAIGDPTFADRRDAYLAGSFFSEAFIRQISNPDFALLALTEGTGAISNIPHLEEFISSNMEEFAPITSKIERELMMYG